MNTCLLQLMITLRLILLRVYTFFFYEKNKNFRTTAKLHICTYLRRKSKVGAIAFNFHHSYQRKQLKDYIKNNNNIDKISI